MAASGLGLCAAVVILAGAALDTGHTHGEAN